RCDQEWEQQPTRYGFLVSQRQCSECSEQFGEKSVRGGSVPHRKSDRRDCRRSDHKESYVLLWFISTLGRPPSWFRIHSGWGADRRGAKHSAVRSRNPPTSCRVVEVLACRTITDRQVRHVYGRRHHL